MEGKDMFWKLCAFGKFDFKRFRKDAEKLKLVKNKAHSTEPPIVESTKSIVNDESNPEENKSVGNWKSSIEDTHVSKENSSQTQKLQKQQDIHVDGTDVPDALESFSDLVSSYGLNKVILRNIQRQNYVEPTPIQKQSITAMLDGRDLMACAPTGSGKTAAFIIPILHHLKETSKMGFRCLVLAPTRELAKQTQREFKKLSQGLGLRTMFIESEATASKRAGKDFDILVTTPNRLLFMIKQNPPLLDLSNVEWLVVDESDRLFEAGRRGFRDQLGAIYTACSSPKLHRAMFSATYAKDVEDWCRLNLDNVIQITVGAKNSATRSVGQKLVFTGDEDGKLIELRNLIRQGIAPPVLIFVQSKERAKELFMELKYDGIKVDVIHSDRPQFQRDAVVKNFRWGRTWVLICTELMSRGMDFKGVNLVINYDFPLTAISYIHRIGRTGRAGKRGEAITFFTEADKPNLRSIAKKVKEAGCPVPSYMTVIKKNKKSKSKAPERKKILQMDPRDVEKLKRKRKYLRQNSQKKKRPKLETTKSKNK